MVYGKTITKRQRRIEIMRGKKQIAAVVLAVILAVAAGIPHSMVYAEPDSTGNAQAADAAADDTQKKRKKKKT